MLNLKVGRGFDLLIEGECHGKIEPPQPQDIVKTRYCGFPANPKPADRHLSGVLFLAATYRRLRPLTRVSPDKRLLLGDAVMSRVRRWSVCSFPACLAVYCYTHCHG